MFISNFGDTQDPILMFLLFDCYGVTCEFKISNLSKNTRKVLHKNLSDTMERWYILVEC